MTDESDEEPSLVFKLKGKVKYNTDRKITLNSVANSINNENWKDPKKWPKSLHDFITRSFKEASNKKFNNNEVLQFKSQLRNLINMAISSNKIMDNDWDKQELPLISGRGRKRLALYCDEIEDNTKNSKTRRDEIKRKSDKDAENVGQDNDNNNGNKNHKRKKNIFGEYDSESESNSDESTDYLNSKEFQNNIKSKPKISLGDSLQRLKKQKVKHNNETVLSDQEKLKLRSKRFERELSIPINVNSTDNISTDPIIGKNQNLEKKYLRLTSQPNPETVRPLNILKKTLQLLFDKYFEGAKYSYLCDQCKSLRQDLTVQNIKKDFSIVAYEFHSKLAIENEDWGEFNQCQSQLKLLYDIKELAKPNYFEFLSYRILYYILTNNYNEIFELELSLISKGYDYSSNEFLNYSLQIFKSIYNSDYYILSETVTKIFFTESIPEEDGTKSNHNNIHLLIDDKDALLLKHDKFYFFKKFIKVIMDRENIQTLSIICKGYRQISVKYLCGILCMKDEVEIGEFFKENKLDNFVIQDTFNCVTARMTVDNLRSKLFKKIDIKGQV